MNLFARQKKTEMPDAATALAGRDTPIATGTTHFVNGRALFADHPAGFQSILIAMGCFWGAERIFWQTEGVWVTSVGYSGGFTPNPTYEETCTGQTGHAEVVEVVFDPAVISLSGILTLFWENHDPTQGMRQGNDVGSQYRSAIYASGPDQLEIARQSRAAYQAELSNAGLGSISTEVAERTSYYPAEDYHQQYLAKNPSGYCGIGGTGVRCPSGLGG